MLLSHAHEHEVETVMLSHAHEHEVETVIFLTQTSTRLKQSCFHTHEHEVETVMLSHTSTRLKQSCFLTHTSTRLKQSCFLTHTNGFTAGSFAALVSQHLCTRVTAPHSTTRHHTAPHITTRPPISTTQLRTAPLGMSHAPQSAPSNFGSPKDSCQDNDTMASNARCTVFRGGDGTMFRGGDGRCP
jgi:hypothetical protein